MNDSMTEHEVRMVIEMLTPRLAQNPDFEIPNSRKTYLGYDTMSRAVRLYVEMQVLSGDVVTLMHASVFWNVEATIEENVKTLVGLMYGLIPEDDLWRGLVQELTDEICPRLGMIPFRVTYLPFGPDPEQSLDRKVWALNSDEAQDIVEDEPNTRVVLTVRPYQETPQK